MIAFIAIAIVVLTILVVCIYCVAREEQRAQQRKSEPEPKYFYTFKGYDEEQARIARVTAQLREAAKRKAADAEVVSLAQRRRSQ